MNINKARQATDTSNARQSKQQQVKAHYGDPVNGVSHSIIFHACACLNVSHFKFLKEFHNSFAYYIKI
jgi:hypothetical protein